MTEEGDRYRMLTTNERLHGYLNARDVRNTQMYRHGVSEAQWAEESVTAARDLFASHVANTVVPEPDRPAQRRGESEKDYRARELTHYAKQRQTQTAQERIEARRQTNAAALKHATHWTFIAQNWRDRPAEAVELAATWSANAPTDPLRARGVYPGTEVLPLGARTVYQVPA